MTILLENDHSGQKLEDFCKGFDPNYKTVRPAHQKDYIPMDSYILVGLLCQPDLDRCVVESAFQSVMHIPGLEDIEYQLHHNVILILSAVRLRESLGIQPLKFEINYRGEDFIGDIKDNTWGEACSSMLKLTIRQNPESLIVNLYKDYQFVQRITEKDLY